MVGFSLFFHSLGFSRLSKFSGIPGKKNQSHRFHLRGIRSPYGPLLFVQLSVEGLWPLTVEVVGCSSEYGTPARLNHVCFIGALFLHSMSRAKILAEGISLIFWHENPWFCGLLPFRRALNGTCLMARTSGKLQRQKKSENQQKTAKNCAPQTLEFPRWNKKNSEKLQETAGSFLRVPLGACH